MASENKSEGIEDSIKPRTIILDQKGENTETRSTDSAFPADIIDWKGLVPGDLPGKSMVDEYPDKDVISLQLAKDVTSELGLVFRCNKDGDLGQDIRLRDIVQLQDRVVAVVTWVFDRKYGLIFRNPKGISEARTMIDINDSEAEVIAGIFNSIIKARIEDMARHNALHRALKDNENRINGLRSECLKNAGLDDDSVSREVARLKRDFYMAWGEVFFPSEKDE